MGRKGSGMMTVKEFFFNSLDENDVLQNNEIQANKLVGFTMFLGSFIFGGLWLLGLLNIIHYSSPVIMTLLIQSIFELIVPAFICQYVKAKKVWLKYILLIELVVVLCRIDSVLGYHVTLIMVIPVILSCRYFSKRFTKVIALLTIVLFGLSAFASSWLSMGFLDLNFYNLPEGTTLVVNDSISQAIQAIGIDKSIRTRNLMLFSYVPKLLIYFIVAEVCIKLATKGRQMVVDQEIITEKTARIESELDLANNIQAHMLPSIFPPFPNREEVDLYASMNPAKEVGGDFYDFFMLDDKNVAFVIADVSGKGVPAALFMVIAKTLIKNEANMGSTPAEVFTKVNHMLCEGNDDGMFVTAWMGVLDTETGLLTYVNAGHNPPLIKQQNGEFTYLKSKPGFVLAGMDGLRYKQFELEMQPGDELLLYTDGVTEAENGNKELYGNDRLQNYMNEHDCENLKETLTGLKADIDLFAGEEEQFDDITMLLMRYTKRKATSEINEKSFLAKNTQLDSVLSFVEGELEKVDCSPKVMSQIAVCIEEIFVNIANYAYSDRKEDMTLGMQYQDGEMVFRFVDHGIPFDPLSKKDPDIHLAAEDREIGGLGIFIVKKTMDDVKYEYQNGMNILTMRKKL